MVLFAPLKKCSLEKNKYSCFSSLRDYIFFLLLITQKHWYVCLFSSLCLVVCEKGNFIFFCVIFLLFLFNWFSSIWLSNVDVIFVGTIYTNIFLFCKISTNAILVVIVQGHSLYFSISLFIFNKSSFV